MGKDRACRTGADPTDRRHAVIDFAEIDDPSRSQHKNWKLSLL
jgi:hypothetical protein